MKEEMLMGQEMCRHILVKPCQPLEWAMDPASGTDVFLWTSSLLLIRPGGLPAAARAHQVFVDQHPLTFVLVGQPVRVCICPWQGNDTGKLGRH